MRKCSVLLASVFLLGSIGLAPAQNNTDSNRIHNLIQFLISDRMLTLNSKGQSIPLSFYVGNEEDISNYFGDYLCRRENTCAVVDSISNAPFAISARGLSDLNSTELEWKSAQAQIERTQLKYGTDIYHGATWQIALALAAKNGFLDLAKARELITNQLENVTNPANRATGLTFKYGEQPLFAETQAFTFRWLSSSFYNQDPFFKGRYQNLISSDFDEATASRLDPMGKTPEFYSYITTWSDRKPLTGKNAWAQLIGPLQAEYLLNDGIIPVNSPALINAMNTLTSFSLMQSGIGAFYFAPAGTEGNQSHISPRDIVIEDNFSVLAGLQIVKNSLQNTAQTAEVNQALERINIMLNGGITMNGYSTNGLLSFLYNGAFDYRNRIFYNSGTAPSPSSNDDWRPNPSDLRSYTAITANLWAISTLGVETIDNWFGSGTALGIWQTVRERAGYFDPINNSNTIAGELWGLGLSFSNNLGLRPEALMSTEETAAAINALNSLIEFYGDSTEILRIKEDLDALKQNIIHLRSDLYLDSHFVNGADREYFIDLPTDLGQAYLYASKRFTRPLDWNANPLASLNATAWVILNHFNFNPFQYRGKLEGENYLKPETVNILNSDLELAEGALTKTVVAHFSAGDLGPFHRLTIKYNLDGSDTNWLTSVITTQREGFVTLPKGAKGISISYFGDNLANACQVIPARNLCIDLNCMNVRTINARWSSNGIGRCDLSPN
ncbi:MAG: hypothetical protein H0U57_10615 [Tatlockia sp.]|nr:hypothetical protein [Tatlockia sp.]